MASILPPELWSHIFALAADEDVLFSPLLPTSFAPSTWTRHIFTHDNTLRTPHDALCILQRRNYHTKKAIAGTCRTFRWLGTEVMVRVLFFDDAAKLGLLANTLDADPQLGWWAKRLHVTQLRGVHGIDAHEDALARVLRRCPNLEIFAVDWPMRASFGAIADTLGTCCRHLRTVSWHVPADLLPKLVWALDTLPALVAVHVTLTPAAPNPHSPLSPARTTLTLGAAQDVVLTLPALHQLSLRGPCADLIEHATHWSLPALRSFAFSSASSPAPAPDILAFLAAHGPALDTLDLDCIPALDVPAILARAPALRAFAFNPDWRLPGPPAHAHIEDIGLHGLLFAFGVGVGAGAGVDPARRLIIQSTNDRNFAMLVGEGAFPRLRRVRVLGRAVLEDLEREDGPARGVGVGRWERWCEACEAVGVRLEDCTGALLGALPPRYVPPDLAGEDEEEEYEYVDEGEEGEYEYVDEEEGEEEYETDPGDDGTGGTGGGSAGGATSTGGGGRVTVTELRQLLEECRLMSAEREEPLAIYGAPGSY
ncbi:hypothetical protein BJ138DRAFT_1011934 [Hygrophoropsis aurantiaca]|uniref:Uncharacterized protein n=1 Tax=Hygrophoropsis aurantiaca TaxID=72124 RepID=A0ACB8A742_9AGAM|nr:hypothetical protein BJ138DRAFT_1011934 [Hygrophoropsis aurantiaca]